MAVPAGALHVPGLSSYFALEYNPHERIRKELLAVADAAPSLHSPSSLPSRAGATLQPNPTYSPKVKNNPWNLCDLSLFQKLMRSFMANAPTFLQASGKSWGVVFHEVTQSFQNLLYQQLRWCGFILYNQQCRKLIAHFDYDSSHFDLNVAKSWHQHKE